MTKYSRGVFLIAVFFVAFFLRLYKLNPVYISSDDLQPIFEAIRIFNRHVFSLNPSDNFIVGFIGFPYGFTIIFNIAIIFLLAVFRLPVTEFLMRLPLSFFGSLTPIGVYFLTRQITKKEKPALFLSLFFALSYFHIFESRFNGRTQITIPLCFSVFAIYFFIKYLEDRRARDCLIASTLIGIYMVSSFLHYAMVLLILYISYIYCGRNIKAAAKALFKKEFLLIPVILYLPYLIAHIYSVFIRKEPTMGFIGHLGLKNKTYLALGFHFNEFAAYLSSNFGTWLSLILIVGVIYGIICLIRSDKKSILFFWFLAYSLPVLLISKRVDNYLLEAVLPLMILSWIGLFDIFGRFIYFNIVLLVTLIFVSIGTLGVIFKLPGLAGMLPEINTGGGSIVADTGAKAAGYFIRKYIPSDYRIFTDYELLVSNFYFDRNIMYAQYDAGVNENLEYFKKIKGIVDVIVTAPRDSRIYLAEIGQGRKFYLWAKIKDKDDVLAEIYVKDAPGVFREIEVSQANLLFDNEFGRLGKIMRMDMKFPKAQPALE